MTSISRAQLQQQILDAAAAALRGEAPGLNFLEGLAEQGLVEEVIRPAPRLHEQGQVAQAALLYRCFLDYLARTGGSHPGRGAIERNLAMAMLQLGDLRAARHHHMRALAAGYQDPSGESAWADFLNQYGLHEAARGEIAARLLTRPDSAPLRSLLFTLREFTDLDPGRHLAENLDWWRGQAPVAELSGPARPVSGRPLRLGVIVRDLRNAASFNRTFDAFPHLHGPEIEIAFASIRGGGELRGELAGLEVHDLVPDLLPGQPERLARALAARRYDLLLDLVSHGNALVFAALRHRPAPVQLTWISNGITSGVPWMDYMLTDPLISPIGSERHYSETLVRVPAPSFAVPGLRQSPDLVPPPCLRNGFVTFGAFNRISKINQASLEAWAEILRRVPNSRLRIQNSNVGHVGVAARLRDFFGGQGIAAERLDFAGYVPEADYLRDIGETDIALEPFPQTGGVTAFDALWMGVPSVVHVVDDRPCCRAALLPASAAGIGALVGASVPDYVDTAVMLAGQPHFLRELRFAMRDRLRAASFTRPEVLADRLRRALLAIWDQACAGPAARAPIWMD